MEKEEPCDNCNNDVCCCIVKEEPKQETIEEVAERIYPIIPNSHPNINWDIINKREGFTEGYKLAQQQNKNLYSEEEVPTKLEPILAKISDINCLGKSEWYEVVYHDDKWNSYAGSKTFQNGEKVVNWKYCSEIFNQNKKK